MKLKHFLFAVLTLAACFARGQHDLAIRNRIFQVSLAPALGTNGLHPGSFNNFFSLNLTAGYSASTRLLEIGILSNLNTNLTRGLQWSGIANITGGNAFGALTKKDVKEKEAGGFSPYLSGAQISGLTNIVLGNAYGAQFSGGVNLDKGGMMGLQVSGLANVVYKYSFGVQLSGLFNISDLSFSGVQAAAVSNYTKGDMEGFQLGAVNQAGHIEGKNTYGESQPTGFQVGLLNRAKKMNGFQFGLINLAGRSQGTQVGLINFYRGGTVAETKDGTAIGLLNFGDLVHISVYMNELFGLNYEISTGTRKNARIKMDTKNKYITNSLIYSHAAHGNSQWAIGYGLSKLFFNRSALPGMGESRFYGYGIDVLHVNTDEGKFTRDLNLLGRMKFVAGRRLAPKLFGVNGFAALTMNFLVSEVDSTVTPALGETVQLKRGNLFYWPGISVGVLLH